MVLLRHTLPDGTHHYDWLLSRCSMENAAAEPDVRDVITLQLSIPPDLWLPGSPVEPLDAQQLPDHRRLYLVHEGEVAPQSPGGPARGRVDRVARGVWSPSDTSQPITEFRAAFADGPLTAWRWSDGHLRTV